MYQHTQNLQSSGSLAMIRTPKASGVFRVRTLCTEYPNVLCHSAGDYMDDRKAMETQDKASTCLSSAGDNTANAQQPLCTLKDGTYWKYRHHKITTSGLRSIKPRGRKTDTVNQRSRWHGSRQHMSFGPVEFCCRESNLI